MVENTFGRIDLWKAIGVALLDTLQEDFILGYPALRPIEGQLHV